MLIKLRGIELRGVEYGVSKIFDLVVDSFFYLLEIA